MTFFFTFGCRYMGVDTCPHRPQAFNFFFFSRSGDSVEQDFALFFFSERADGR